MEQPGRRAWRPLGQLAAALGLEHGSTPNPPDRLPAAVPSGAFQVQKLSMEKVTTDHKQIPQ